MFDDLIKQWVMESPLMKVLGTRYYDHSITISFADIEIDNEDTGYTLEIFVEADSGELVAYTKKANHWFDGLGVWQTDWKHTDKIDLHNHLNGWQYEELKGLLKAHYASSILRRATVCKN